MICPNCGSENRDDVSSCTNCGQRFGPRPNTAQQDNRDAADDAAQNLSHQDKPYSQDAPYSQTNFYSQDNNYSHGPYGSQQPNSGYGGDYSNYTPNNSSYGSNDTSYNPNDSSYSNNASYNPNGGSYGSYSSNYGPNNNSYSSNGTDYNPNGGYGPDNYNYGPQNMNGGYNQNPYQGPGGREPFNGMAVAALVIGIISAIPCCLFPYIGIPLNIVGLVLGIISRRKPFGRGMSIAGIVLNIIFLVLATVWLIVVLYIYFNIPAQTVYDVYQNYMY